MGRSLGAAERGARAMLRGIPMVAVALALAGCGPKVPRIPGPLDHLGGAPLLVAPPSRLASPDVARGVKPPSGFADEVIDAAEHYLEHAPHGFRDDCSGYVMAVFSRAGLDLEGNTASLYEWAEERGYVHHRNVPRPGDLAFFDDTYDRNDNGRLDDELSHIAVVLSVDDDGTVTLAQGGVSKGRSTMVMNLKEPDVHEDPSGKVVNDWLRVKHDSDPAKTPYLSGELWHAFATVTEDAGGTER